MTPGDRYRRMAAEFRARARSEGTHRLSTQWDHLADCYLRLSEQADQNSLTDVAAEFGPKPSLDDDQI
jgi:hypothetical protein